MKGDLTTQQDNSRFSIVRPQKMDVDNKGRMSQFGPSATGLHRGN